MNWGRAITLVFLAFASFIGYLVVSAHRMEVPRSTDNAYGESLTFEDRQTRFANLRQLGGAVNLKLKPASGLLEVTLPLNGNDPAVGEIHFLNTGSSARDKRMTLKTDSLGHQTFPVETLGRGGWSVHLEWTSNGTPYAYETFFTLP